MDDSLILSYIDGIVETWRRKENNDAFPPLSSQNQHKSGAHCAENKQGGLEKLMRDETGTQCECAQIMGVGGIGAGGRLQGI